MGAHFGQGFEYSETCLTGSTNLRMKTMLLFSLLAAAAFAAPEARFSCSECVDEMHKLGWMVKMGAVPIHDYVAANYCPTLGEDQGWCEEALSRYYLACCLPLLSTTLSMEPSMFVRLEGLVMLSRSTPATSVSKALNGWRRTSRTRSWLLSTLSTLSRTTALVEVTTTWTSARGLWSSTSPTCT